MSRALTTIVLLGLGMHGARAQEGVSFHSPGLPPSRMDGQARLVEDWGPVAVGLRGSTRAPKPKVEEVRIEDVIPGARATWREGAVEVRLTAYRAPVWPAGLDVLTVGLEEMENRPLSTGVVIRLPAGARLGDRAASIGGRRVLIVPDAVTAKAEKRAWGFDDDATSMLGWARPVPGFDPAFSNIRAGMGGVPILYRFKVGPQGAADVALGFCESYWKERGSRFMTCKVEGADPVEVDPLARWGQHRPGALIRSGKDSDGDGQLDVLVVAGPGSPDRNPILNAVWLFAPGQDLDPGQIIRGRLNTLALRYVDVGGKRDQALHATRKLEFPVSLRPRERRELTFLVACRGASLPSPRDAVWTPARLRKAAREVWRDWRPAPPGRSKL